MTTTEEQAEYAAAAAKADDVDTKTRHLLTDIFGNAQQRAEVRQSDLSADTPAPERVTLTATYPHQCCAESCVEEIGLHNVDADTAKRAIEFIAAREQALREEIAGEIETMPLPDAPHGCRYTRAAAADLARGGAR